MRRSCYIETNAAFRHYRMQLMNHLWNVHRHEVTEAGSERLEASRHGHHVAFAEAQMVASPAVLAQLDDMSRALSEGYRRTKCLEEGNPDDGDTLEVIQDYLGWIWERWKETRAAMRTDLGVPNSPIAPPGTATP